MQSNLKFVIKFFFCVCANDKSRSPEQQQSPYYIRAWYNIYQLGVYQLIMIYLYYFLFIKVSERIYGKKIFNFQTFFIYYTRDRTFVSRNKKNLNVVLSKSDLCKFGDERSYLRRIEKWGHSYSSSWLGRVYGENDFACET